METSKIPPNPSSHFHLSNPTKPPINMDKSIGTIDPSLEIDHVPELIDFKARTPTPTRTPRNRRHLAESADNVQKVNPKVSKKYESTSSLTNPDESSDPRKLRKPRPEAKSHKPGKLKITEESLDVKKERKPDKGPDRSSITCPSVASSEAFSLNSTSSKQPEKIASRPTSSCGSTKGFRNFRSRVNSRPRSGGYFGWDIPDNPEGADAVDAAADGLDPASAADGLAASVDGPAAAKASSTFDAGDSANASDCATLHADPKSIAKPPLNMNALGKPDKLISESFTLQTPQKALHNATDEKDQHSLALNSRNAEEKMHKSRLPVRQTEMKKNSKIHDSSEKSGRAYRKKEDFSLQVSASAIKSGSDDNSRNSSGREIESNQELSRDRTMGGISKEINMVNQEEQGKSLAADDDKEREIEEKGEQLISTTDEGRG